MRVLHASLIGLFAATFAVGCAPTSPSSLSGTGGSTGAHTTGSHSTGASSNDGGGGSASTATDKGSSSTGFSDATGNTSSTSMTCAASTVEAEVAPLAMYIMFDKSGSMADNNKWTNASNALKAFFADPKAAGLEVALRFFPEGNCDGNQCDVDACATPKVDAAALSANAQSMDPQEQALVMAVNSTSPSGNTPMYAALKGAVKWGKQFEAAHTDHKTVVILVTDGEPNGCITDTDQIANEAAVGVAAGINTFAIGLQGSNETTINKIAMAGGSQQGFFIGNGNTESDLVQALEAIRGKAIACELTVPMPTMGTFDPMKVNVTYTPGAGGEQTVGYVASKSACGTSPGWYYDDPQNPTKIELCPNTCDSVQGDDKAKINIELGCDTIPQ